MAYPQRMGVVSQMLKGCTLSGTITPELYNMCYQQADGILGGQVNASKFLGVRSCLCSRHLSCMQQEQALG